MTELVARINGNGAGMRMRGVFERLTWPIRKLVWTFEERVFWPLGDVFRRGPKTPEIEPMEPETVEIAPELATAKTEKKFRTPIGGRIDTSKREATVVLGTIAVAIAVGIGIATILGHSSSIPKSSSLASQPASVQAPAPVAAASSGPATLHGVTPNFKASDHTAAAAAPAQAATVTPATPVEKTNSKPSSIPTSAPGNAAAIKTARSFSGAFVLYEIGKTDPRVLKTFRTTATPALATALADRPPRLPSNVKVPTAKVQNIVLGAGKGKEVEASVSLLRLGTLSELRLTLINQKKQWLISEVRG
jgi:hypothetical protein